MEEINFLYIDDTPEEGLEKYLESYTKDGFDISYDEIIFDQGDGYESLINNPTVQCANIIFIDSKLFENRTASIGKFTGEEFKIILRKYYPFIEVIVVTQNESDEILNTVSKYDSRSAESAEEYYSRMLKTLIDYSVNNIRSYRKIGTLMEENKKWGEVLKERISNSLNGTTAYDEFSKNDIDELISVFKKIQESANA